MTVAILSVVAALAPGILKIIFAIFERSGMKKERRQKLMQDIIDNAKENVAIKLREDFQELMASFDVPQDDDPF
jgi:hypothetical protein